MSYAEEAITIACSGELLVGVLAAPEPGTASELGVLIVVGGPQVRVGSHRQFTLLARFLAEAGYPVLRFDVRGMGDSSGAPRTFDTLDDDIDAAMLALQQHRPSVQRVVLWGLCDGASAALLYADSTADIRVAGLCLLNPWVRSDVSMARTHVKHYYAHRLMQVEFWRKFLGGGVARRALSEFFLNLKLARHRPNAEGANQLAFQRRMARGLSAFGGPVLLLLSGNDYTAREFVEYTSNDPEWCANLARPTLTRVDLDGADHTFSSTRDRCRVETATLDWLNTIRPLPSRSIGKGSCTGLNSTELV